MNTKNKIIQKQFIMSLWMFIEDYIEKNIVNKNNNELILWLKLITSIINNYCQTNYNYKEID